MQAPWAKYFSKWISAYKAHGVKVWGVTVQNEPENAAAWEGMLYTPKFMASFVRDFLGPTLKADHPDVVIIGFDHNKDHVVEWATGLYADPEAAKFFAGVGVHWCPPPSRPTPRVVAWPSSRRHAHGMAWHAGMAV